MSHCNHTKRATCANGSPSPTPTSSLTPTDSTPGHWSLGAQAWMPLPKTGAKHQTAPGNCAGASPRSRRCDREQTQQVQDPNIAAADCIGSPEFISNIQKPETAAPLPLPNVGGAGGLDRIASARRHGGNPAMVPSKAVVADTAPLAHSGSIRHPSYPEGRFHSRSASREMPSQGHAASQSSCCISHHAVTAARKPGTSQVEDSSK